MENTQLPPLYVLLSFFEFPLLSLFLSLSLSLSSSSIRVPSLFVFLRHFSLKVKRDFGRFSGTFKERERGRSTLR